MTLIELMVAVATSAVVMGGFFVFLQSVTRSSANDVERSASLVEQAAAMHRIVQELSETYKLNYPTAAGEYNYVDVDAWLTKSGGSQEARRLVINCEVESPIAGEEQCVRYETEVGDTTEVSALSKDAKAKSRVDLVRLADGTKKVFKLSDPSGLEKGRPTYGRMLVETPGAGERVTYKNQYHYSYEVTLSDSFYMRNLDLKQ